MTWKRYLESDEGAREGFLAERVRAAKRLDLLAARAKSTREALQAHAAAALVAEAPRSSRHPRRKRATERKLCKTRPGADKL